ncbi:dihydrolipoyl dehydrogenase [Marinicellulosiphila megalodicopiae]|uniref:dihydrolipoyl dehydrogenase n=1 Tax=Marinicellulosiphila megalodicopiae TaxID=2724896 RepID=UPI003BB15CF3
MAHHTTEVLVIGSGPGGHSAAFRLADLGKKVTLVEKYSDLGGVCLNVGCIPSKALLHVADVINEVNDASEIGVITDSASVDLDKVKAFKNATVRKLSSGVGLMAKGRNVNVVKGEAQFLTKNSVQIGEDIYDFNECIIAAGSRSVELPFIPNEDLRVWNSTDALSIPFIPKRFLVIGGGIIGLEMATIYEALGSKVTIVEFNEQLIPAADKDLIKVYQRYNAKRFDVRLNSKVTEVIADSHALSVTILNDTQASAEEFDAILVAVGRSPNGHLLSGNAIGLEINAQGFIPVNNKMQTNIPHIYAIGDINGPPMLAHKATHEANIAAEVICDHNVVFDVKTIPSIAYTNPEIAWTGITEKEAKHKGINYEVSVFPWSASGRALGANRSEGKTKLIFAKETGLLLGAGIVGINAGELLGELSLAIEFGVNIEDIALTIHAHPTLSESIGLAAEVGLGTITDLPNLKAVTYKKS